MMQAMCKHLTTYGGSALIGDYGHWGENGDTFRVSIRNESYLQLTANILPEMGNSGG
jgi:hypothetical protein